MSEVLIAGASGLVGTAAVNSFSDDGWDVVALSRRAPHCSNSVNANHLSVDLHDNRALWLAASHFRNVTHLVYAAAYEMPGLIDGWTRQEHIESNSEMFRAILDVLLNVSQLQHVVLLQGAKAYGVHLHRIPVPARERFDRDPHANFYWMQEDYLKSRSDQTDVTWTILRPMTVIGPNYGVAMNNVPVIGVYAAICRELGRPFGFPGGPSTLKQGVDVRVLGSAIRWAATTDAARNETFNVTNGEVFDWRDLWPGIADVLGVAQGPDNPTRLAEFLPQHAGTWARIVDRYGLRRLTLQQVLGLSHHVADFGFSYGLESAPPPALVTDIKIRQAGFHETCDTEESVHYWLATLMDQGIIPTSAC